MKKILVSLSIIGAIAAIVVGATTAYFSDTETSTGNTFTAGTLDLTIALDQKVTTGPGTVTVTPGTATQNGVNVYFTVTGVAPGSAGTNVWKLQNIGSLPGTLTIAANYSDADNSLTEPEDPVDADDLASGELPEAMVFDLFRDDTKLVVNGDISAVLAALNTQSVSMASGASVDYTLNWSIPAKAGNEIQSDSLTLNITFTLKQ